MRFWDMLWRLTTYPLIPFGQWIPWAKRREALRSRTPVDLRCWSQTLAPGRDWDQNLCSCILKCVGSCFHADPERVRPDDRFHHELGVPHGFVQRRCWGGLMWIVGLIMENRREFSEWPRPPLDLRQGTVGDLLDYLDSIWKTYPKKVDKATGMRIEPETDG